MSLDVSSYFRGHFAPVGAESRTRSEANLTEMADQAINPHTENYANSLLWATPDKKYALKVVYARGIIRAALEPEFYQSLMNGEMLPTISVYSKEKSHGVYNVRNQVLQLLSPDSVLQDQLLIQHVEPEGKQDQYLTPESLTNLKEFLNSSGTADYIYRATIPLEKKYAVRLENEIPYEQLNNVTFLEAIKIVHDFFVQKGGTSSEVQEDLAEGLFSGVRRIRKMAEEATLQ